jgi:hypothetical protein
LASDSQYAVQWAAVRAALAQLSLATLAFACVPEPMNPVGVSDDFREASPAEARSKAHGSSEALAPLANFGKPLAARFWAEGHSYRRFTIEVWGNDIARNSTLSGAPAAVGSEFLAAHFVDEQDTEPLMFFSMRKVAEDGGAAWVYRAYEANREPMVLDPKPCEGCHAMARSDSRFTPTTIRVTP